MYYPGGFDLVRISLCKIKDELPPLPGGVGRVKYLHEKTRHSVQMKKDLRHSAQFSYSNLPSFLV